MASFLMRIPKLLLYGSLLVFIMHLIFYQKLAPTQRFPKWLPGIRKKQAVIAMDPGEDVRGEVTLPLDETPLEAELTDKIEQKVWTTTIAKDLAEDRHVHHVVSEKLAEISKISRSTTTVHVESTTRREVRHSPTQAPKANTNLSADWRKVYPGLRVVRDKYGYEVFKGDWRPKPNYPNEFYDHRSGYVISNSEFCEGKSPKIVILVESKTSQYRLRQNWRQNWGNATYRRDDIEILYIVAKSKETEYNENIQEEYSKYKDLIQLNFTDTYHNLPKKTINALRWVKDYCNQTHYVMKTDDDVMVFLDRLRCLIDALPTTGVYTGSTMYTIPLRPEGPEGKEPGYLKYIVSHDLYPFQYYLNYISGYTITLSTDSLIGIVNSSQHINVTAPFEDLFVGMCAYISGLKPQGTGKWEHYYYNILPERWLLSGNYTVDACGRLIAVHGVRGEQIRWFPHVAKCRCREILLQKRVVQCQNDRQISKSIH